MGYGGKVHEREMARVLRASGLTMPEIAERLGVSRSSVSLWVRDVPIQPKLDRLGRARGERGPNKLQLQKQIEIEAMNRRGADTIGAMSERDLLIAGTALYAAEGSKGDKSFRFANTDPRLISLMCTWLRTFFVIEETRLRGRLYLHQGLDLDAAITFWAGVTQIPPSQFGKPYRAAPDAGIRHTKHLMGCLTVCYSCARTHRIVMGMVRALSSGAFIPG